MLNRLRVHELGVIESLDVNLGPGLTVITGETGAGKTLIVEALELLCGGRSDSGIVRAGASEASVDGIFCHNEREVLVSRVVPRSGRSRAEVDGKLATLAMLEELATDLVDLHGQHAHQSLLKKAVQRTTLDQFGEIDLGPVIALRDEVHELKSRLAGLGGDDAMLARELDLLHFELKEIESAQIDGEEEIERLGKEEEVLASAAALREATASAVGLLEGPHSEGAADQVGLAIDRVGAFEVLREFEERLRSAHVELIDVVSELHRAQERFEDDPLRLESVRERRELLRRLARKHGGSLKDVLNFANAPRARVGELETSDEARQILSEQLAATERHLEHAEMLVGDARRGAAPLLASAIEAHLRKLALANARIEVRVGEDRFGEEVEFFLAANPGEPAVGIAKAASGGELARTMLAIRLVLSRGPHTLVFDEVDAGIGGEAALAVGAALAALGGGHQVLVVTHLAQVAAYANLHVVVGKREVAGRTVAFAAPVEGKDRLAELARMLSGHPESPRALEHAAELLDMVKEGAHGRTASIS